jgi:MFS transporter, DHA2 family, methylenomycin A resistance protein
VDRSRSGIASGTLTALRQTGSLLGVALFGSLVASRRDFFGGLHSALVVSAVLLVASAELTRLLATPRERVDE